MKKVSVVRAGEGSGMSRCVQMLALCVKFWVWENIYIHGLFFLFFFLVVVFVFLFSPRLFPRVIN